MPVRIDDTLINRPFWQQVKSKLDSVLAEQGMIDLDIVMRASAAVDSCETEVDDQTGDVVITVPDTDELFWADGRGGKFVRIQPNDLAYELVDDIELMNYPE